MGETYEFPPSTGGNSKVSPIWIQVSPICWRGWGELCEFPPFDGMDGGNFHSFPQRMGGTYELPPLDGGNLDSNGRNFMQMGGT